MVVVVVGRSVKVGRDMKRKAHITVSVVTTRWCRIGWKRPPSPFLFVGVRGYERECVYVGRTCTGIDSIGTIRGEPDGNLIRLTRCARVFLCVRALVSKDLYMYVCLGVV